MNHLLYYDCMATFKQQYYKDLLTPTNLIESERFFDKVKDMDGEDILLDDKYCFVLEKDGKRYLLPSQHKKELPIKVTREMKLAYRNEAYYYIVDFQTARFKSMRYMSFKTFVDKLASFQHSNKEHYTLLWMIGMASMLDRTNVRISTPAGFGKDSIVDTCGVLFGEAATIENPTIAKLEYMTAVKWLAVNEVVGIAKGEWLNVEQFLLQCGAFKPVVTKHSRAISGVGEMLSIGHLSLSLLYNDIDHYVEEDKYFDSVSKKAVQDRFLPLRLHGTFEENFNSINSINIYDFIEQHKEDYEFLIRTFVYYKNNYEKEMHQYQATIPSLPARWKTNYGRLLRIIDLYSQDQEEFDKWKDVLDGCVDDYKAMIKYPKLLDQLTKKFGDTHPNIGKVKSFKGSFVERNKRINSLLTGEVKMEDKSFW